MIEIPLTEPLWRQKDAARFASLAVSTLRASGCPKILITIPGSRKPLVRYVPSQVRDWLQARSTMQGAA